MKSKKVIIIGSGFASLAAACYLSKAKYKVTVLEKNEVFGGRARQLKHQGFNFDMGPTFYWMPNVFESFFKDFDFQTTDFYALEKLNPSYQIYFDKGESISIPDNLEGIISLFESVEAESGKALKAFINSAEDNYKLAINKLVYQPGEHIKEIITWQTVKKVNLFFDTIRNQVCKTVKHSWLRKILEFPVLFLGASPSDTPAFYNFMNYADFGLGTWHPKGGMYVVVEAMIKLAKSLGVTFLNNSEILKIVVENKTVIGVQTHQKFYKCDLLLSGADYAHTETLLPKSYRQYSHAFWDKKTFAPSALMFYVGFNKELKNVSHHTLFFDTDFDKHSKHIYKTKTLPDDPLFYVSFPSKTDTTVAPKGNEAAIFLIPLAPDSADNKIIRDEYFNKIIKRLERLTNQKVKEHILFSKSFGVNDFISNYNSYKGNAYGLANTLLQTHILRPKMRSRKLNNMFFTGQLTVPGPGVPPSIISGKIVSELISK